ncbi:uncharacterized protein LOC128375841 [Scomber japonicus]|uniref:uncharacterized protein LOC128375841 n=1 Tax=Scomber japonicus TaxID=13676 RepID=UPI002304F26F|nr:uncharacterized protein LOC128375841 [Scomber japonicus]
MFFNLVIKHIKMIVFFCITFNIILVSGSSLSDQVHQTPANMYKKPGEQAKINCSHSIQSYDRILWYKQLEDRQLDFLGYMGGDTGIPEKQSGVEITGSANKDQNCTLTVEGLKLNSTSHLNFFNMMFMVFMFCFLHLPGNNGASHTTNVLQTPPFIIKRTGESVDHEIYCAHKIKNYDVILWYKQDKYKYLKLLGYLNVNILNPEEDVKGNISFIGDGRTHSNLTISDVSLNDSAVYFCAASQHSAADSPQLTTKTLHLFNRQTKCIIDGNDVNQIPILWKDKEHNATIHCSHTKDATYYQMYWYRQLPGERMKQIVYTTLSPPHQYENGFTKARFPAEKEDYKSGSLTVVNLLPEDSGVYFCAVSEHSDIGD